MRTFAIVAVIALAGCDVVFRFDERVIPDAPPPDQPVPVFTVPHLVEPIALGEGDFVLDGGTINTTTDSIGGAQPGVAHAILPMTAGGMALVVRARTARLSGTVVVRGDNALIVFAETITITGILDGGADGTTDGPGASDAAGAGMTGGNVNTNNAGSGGGGFGGAGGIGGEAGIAGCTSGQATPGPAGSVFGDATLMTLEGGGRGGGGGGDLMCPASPGGGGGGAIQLSATTQITVEGTVDVGGGGGAGGASCAAMTPKLSRSGAGGGAGGAIYLDAPMIELPGVLAANGGGGGSGGTTAGVGNCGQYAAGNAGADGTTSLTPAAGGLVVDMTCSRAGGRGATAGMAAGGGGPLNCDGSAGGGGGGVGRIVLRGLVGTTNVITPPATPVPR